MAEQFDIVVIGGGPGGYVAAIRAAQLGQKTALVEANHLGGICLNWGCIPTKTLLRTSELYHLMNHAADFGLKAEKIDFDLKKIIQRSRDVASQLSTGIKHLMKKNKVKVYEARGKLAGNNKVELDTGDFIEAKKIILATGARARKLPSLPDSKNIWTYREAMTPTRMPKKLVVIGSGAIGIEFASFYSDMGADVTVIEAFDRVVPGEDKEISEVAMKAFTSSGIKCIVNAKVMGAVENKDGITLSYEENGKTHKVSADTVIQAIGVVANTENMGFETTKVKVHKGLVDVNGFMQTAEPNIYAIGDITTGPWLAHKASHEGVIAAEHAAGHQVHEMDKNLIPRCTYCRPQIASIGLTEDQAKEKGKTVRVGRFPYLGNGKAIAMGDTTGMIKTVFDADTGALLGAHMIGAEVTELIQGYGIAMGLETTEAELMNTIFAHPTLSEMMHESVLSAFDRALHI